MNRIISAFLHKLTFQRQLGITVTSGIFMLALFSSVVGSWLGNERVRSNLLEQGRHITESLARQSTLALIYASAENAGEAAAATLSFPGVTGIEIRDANQHVLLQHGITGTPSLPQAGKLAGSGAVLAGETADAWRFIAPVYSQRPASSPFQAAPAPELLGYATVVFSKAALTQLTTGIFLANLSTSLSFALLFLLLLRFLSSRMAQPLNQLSTCMGKAEAGNLQVRAVLSGPKDIADMSRAFNSMMAVLEGHATAIHQLNAELEQRVAQRTAQLEAANKELEEFSYSMSHDMRTPLRALDGFSRILLEEHGDRLDDEGKRLLRVLRDNALRMGRLVDDILHYLSLGRKKIEPGPIDMSQLAQEICAEMQAAAPARRLNAKIGPLPPAWGDRTMIREVLQHLLSNAVKFSPTDGEAPISIDGSRREGENVYSVTDHGIGFDMRYADKLFRVFERVHPTGQYEGSGIGLAIVKRIIERHGGRAWAEGKVNEGTTIYFSLPAKEKDHG